MIQDRNRLAKNSIIYSVFMLLQRAFSVLLLPIYTLYLSKEEYGILSLMLAAIPLFSLVFGLSIRGSSAYFYYENKDNKTYLKRLLGTNFTFVLLVSVLSISVIIVFKDWFTTFFFADVPFSPYVLLALASSLLQPSYLFYQSILKAKQEAKKSATLDSIYFIIAVALTILFIVVLKFQAEGALLAMAVANLVVFTISVINISKEITYCIDLDKFKKTLKYSLPILPHNLSGWAMDLADRILLNKLSTLEVLASFDLGAQVSKLLNIITLGVNQAYGPWFIEQAKSEKVNLQKLAKTAEFLSLFYIILAICLSWVSPELINIIGQSSYTDSWVVVPFIAFAFSLNGFYYCFSNVFFLNKTKYLPMLTIAGAIFNIGINLFLIPIFGILGAAIARLASKIIFTLLTLLVSQKLFFIPYRKSFIGGAYLLGFGIASLVYLIQPHLDTGDIWLVLSFKLLIILTFLTPLAIRFKKELLSVFKKQKISG